MSALSVSSPLPSPAAPAPAQGSQGNAPADNDTPFASVLQQKVQSGKQEQSQGDAKPADTKQNAAGDAAKAPASAQNQPGNGDRDNAPNALEVAQDNAQGALQQLLPWLQGLQGKDAKAQDKTRPGADADATNLLPQAAAVTPQVETPKLAVAADPAKGGAAGKATDAAADAARGLKADPDSAKAAGSAANSAAKDALPVDAAGKAAHTSFADALNQAGSQPNPQLAVNNHNTPTAAAAASSTGDANRLQSPLGSTQWQNELGDRVQLMSRNNESRAELVLTPPQLGRIEVSLHINGDQATAMFVSPNPEVRTALEGAMERLRETLANSGIALGQTQVGAESSGQWSGGESNGQRSGTAGMNGAGVDAGAAAGTSAWTRHSNNMLDVFA